VELSTVFTNSDQLSRLVALAIVDIKMGRYQNAFRQPVELTVEGLAVHAGRFLGRHSSVVTRIMILILDPVRQTASLQMLLVEYKPAIPNTAGLRDLVVGRNINRIVWKVPQPVNPGHTLKNG
jgi:hypothetical protein